MDNDLPGYHLKKIQKGVLGEVSKIREEVDELEDALAQNVKIMIGVELSDLYGAIRAYAKTVGLTMADLEQMANVTERAFKNGRR